jgi:hypothetical protein
MSDMLQPGQRDWRESLEVWGTADALQRSH